MARVVDSQVHVWLPERPGAPWPEGGARLAAAHRPSLTVEELLGEMDRAGVDRAMLVPPMFEGFHNEYALECARAHPDRLRVMARLDLSGAAEDTRGRLDALAGDDRVSGLRLVFLDLPGGAGPLAAAASSPVWDLLAERSLPVMLSAPGQTGDIGELARRHPGLRIAVDHLGLSAPATADVLAGEVERLVALASLPNVSVKASALPCYSTAPAPHTELVELTGRVVEAFGTDRVFWGSDLSRLPASSTYRDALDVVAAAVGPDPDRLDAVLGGALERWAGWTDGI